MIQNETKNEDKENKYELPLIFLSIVAFLIFCLLAYGFTQILMGIGLDVSANEMITSWGIFFTGLFLFSIFIKKWFNVFKLFIKTQKKINESDQN